LTAGCAAWVVSDKRDLCVSADAACWRCERTPSMSSMPTDAIATCNLVEFRMCPSVLSMGSFDQKMRNQTIGCGLFCGFQTVKPQTQTQTCPGIGSHGALPRPDAGSR
jgi:hypothetical protein